MILVNDAKYHEGDNEDPYLFFGSFVYYSNFVNEMNEREREGKE